ncbi:MAG TPA: hypothetical protein VGM30_00310 [Puia sp.]
MRKLHCLPVSIQLLIRPSACVFLSRRFPDRLSLSAILSCFSAIRPIDVSSGCCPADVLLVVKSV